MNWPSFPNSLLPLDKGWTMLDHLVQKAEEHRKELESLWGPNLPKGRIKAPVIICGPHRTGTTFLHRALATAMPERRTLLGWEAMIPLEPNRGSLEDRINDERCVEWRAVTDALYEAVPKLKELHDESPDLPAECAQAMTMTGLTGIWPALAECHQYRDWMMSYEAGTYAFEAYKWYERCLLHMDPNASWLLKAPAHSLYLEAILDTWPDAKIIYINRPHGRTASSTIEFFNALHQLSKPDEDHRMEIESWVDDYIWRHRARVESTPGHFASQFLRLENSDLRQEPEATVARVAGWIRND